MMSFMQYLKEHHALPITQKHKIPRRTLKEGIAMDPRELMDELIAMNAKSIHAQIVTDNDSELTLFLQLKKSN